MIASGRLRSGAYLRGSCPDDTRSTLDVGARGGVGRGARVARVLGDAGRERDPRQHRRGDPTSRAPAGRRRRASGFGGMTTSSTGSGGSTGTFTTTGSAGARRTAIAAPGAPTSPSARATPSAPRAPATCRPRPRAPGTSAPARTARRPARGRARSRANARRAVTPTMENCTDGIDHDCNGKVGCADPSCASNAACTGACQNGADAILLHAAPPAPRTSAPARTGRRRAPTGNGRPAAPAVLPAQEVCSDFKDHNCNGPPSCSTSSRASATRPASRRPACPRTAAPARWAPATPPSARTAPMQTP